MKPSPRTPEQRRVKCPSCPDGQLWDSNGPTSDACLTCGGEAWIWEAEPEMSDDELEEVYDRRSRRAN